MFKDRKQDRKVHLKGKTAVKKKKKRRQRYLPLKKLQPISGCRTNTLVSEGVMSCREAGASAKVSALLGRSNRISQYKKVCISSRRVLLDGQQILCQARFNLG